MATYAALKPRADGKRSPSLARVFERLAEYEQADNIAALLSDDELKTIGYDVDREYDIDKRSRSDWEDSAKKATDVALQVRQPKNYPFSGAANIKYPLVTVAALQFGARAYPAIVDGTRIVKGQVLGRDDGIPQTDELGEPRLDPMNGEPLWITPPGVKKAKADRVSQHMSYQLLCEMEEWEEDTDVLLHHLPIVGCAFRKVRRSAELRRNKAEMVPAIHLVVNNKVRSLDEAPRVTHELFLYPQDIEERMRSGTFIEVDLPAPADATGQGSNDDAPHMFLEQHRYLDLDNDGYREPYIVTVHKDSCQVVRIVANYRLENVVEDGKRIIRIPKEQYFVKYSFLPDPKGGFYDIGFGKLLESLSETIDTTINQMLDAGHLQNAGGGFIGSGVRLKKKEIKVAPGRFEQVDASGDLRQQIYSHEHPGPSPVLFQLLGMMVEAARDITAVKDILTGESTESPQTATTTLALIEQGLKVFTAIYKRVYRALKHEFKLLARLNAQHLDQQEYFTFLDQQQVVAREDYDLSSMDIVPVADPKMVTDMQRSARANLVLQVSGHPVLGPTLVPHEATKYVFDTAGMAEEAEKLVAKPQQGPSPVQELQMRDLAADVAKKEAGAEKDLAQADKTKLETALLPAEAAMEARKIDNDQMRAEHDMAMGEVGMAVDVESGRRSEALERERMAFEAQERELEREAAAEKAREPA